MKLFKNSKLGVRLAAGFALVIAIGLVSALINNYSIGTAIGVAQQIKERNFPYALLAEELAFDVEQVAQLLTDVGATRETEGFAEAEVAARRFKEGVAKFKVMYQGKKDAGSVRKLEEIERDFDSFYGNGKLMAQAYVGEGVEAGNRMMGPFDRDTVIISGKIRDFKDSQREEADRVLQKLSLSLARTRSLLWSLALLSVILGGVISWRITRSITAPIGEGAIFAQSVAGGDLTGRIQPRGEDEVGQMTAALDAMARDLNGMVCNIKASAGELTEVSGSISSVSQRVLDAATVQARGVEDTSTAITQINTSIKGVADGVEMLAQSASETSSSAMEMAASVEEVAQNVQTLAESVEEVSTSITETAAAVRQIDGSAAFLKDTYLQTAASVAEMDGSIRQVEQNAREAAAISGEVLMDAETGKASVEATGAGIAEIKRASMITSEVIADLSRRAGQIGEMLSVIDNVAAQTNLLALNAAIIAAQAGEQGKGFAVVAEEIKLLAERTSNSTREIEEVIRGVQKETARAVEAITAAEKSIANGEELSERSAGAIAKMVSGMQKASGQVAQIADATVEQAKGSRMIRQAMEQVSVMVDQIAVATGEQRKGSELIAVEVERMRGLTTQVRTSTHEQAKTGSSIAKSTAEITAMIERIRLSCHEQSRGSEQIVHAIEEIRQSTDGNLESAQLMEAAVSTMSGQIELLDKEMAGFKVVTKAG